MLASYMMGWYTKTVSMRKIEKISSFVIYGTQDTDCKILLTDQRRQELEAKSSDH